MGIAIGACSEEVAVETADVLLTPAVGAVLMSASKVIMAINARLLRLQK